MPDIDSAGSSIVSQAGTAPPLQAAEKDWVDERSVRSWHCWEANPACWVRFSPPLVAPPDPTSMLIPPRCAEMSKPMGSSTAATSGRVQNSIGFGLSDEIVTALDELGPEDGISARTADRCTHPGRPGCRGHRPSNRTNRG